MFEVIISTISSGKVRRKLFDTLAEAEQCADTWDRKESPWGGRKPYRVEVQHRDVPVVQAVAGVVTAKAMTGEAA